MTELRCGTCGQLDYDEMMINHTAEVNNAYQCGWDACRKTIGELEPEKWISIKDELPEVDTEVLLHLNDGLIRIASLENDKNWLVSQTYFIDWDDASHWIPLPAPPKAEVSK